LSIKSGFYANLSAGYEKLKRKKSTTLPPRQDATGSGGGIWHQPSHPPAKAESVQHSNSFRQNRASGFKTHLSGAGGAALPEGGGKAMNVGRILWWQSGRPGVRKAVSYLRCPYMFDFVRFCSILSGFWLASKAGG